MAPEGASGGGADGWPGLPRVDGPCAVTIGVFDGVHRGHLRLIEALRERARSDGLRPTVVTFRNHPLSVLRPDFEPAYLCGVERRVELLCAAGAQVVEALDFTAETAAVPAADFVDALTARMGMRALVVGPDFALGRGREGDLAFLTEEGRRRGFSVDAVRPLEDGGQRIGSTRIRRALAAGDVAGAARLLGRGFELTGLVVRGHGRGGPLGFPTANLSADGSLAVPATGIYAAWARLGGPGRGRMMCAVSVGTNPTFDGTERTVEAFVLDFDGDLYGERLTLEFVRRLRDEERFDSAKALAEQVRRDVEDARCALGGGR